MHIFYMYDTITESGLKHATKRRNYPMNEDIKNIVIFYSITLLCFQLSSIGIYLFNIRLGMIYQGFTLFLIPLLFYYQIIVSLTEIKETKESKQ